VRLLVCRDGGRIASGHSAAGAPMFAFAND
jgi:hypothetical protein